MIDATVETREEWPLIERVRVLDLSPNDCLVLEYPGDLTGAEILDLKDQWVSAFPGHREPVILTGGLSLACVLREGK